MHELTKAIDKAFAFHPYGFEKPMQYDQWVMGPTFIVRVDQAEEEMAFNALGGIYMTDPNWQIKFTKLLGEAKNATVDINLDKNKHQASPKCTYRMFTDEPDCTYPLELGYPLVMLSKKLGVDTWKTTPGANNVMVFGYRQTELVGVFAGRRVIPEHVVV